MGMPCGGMPGMPGAIAGGMLGGGTCIGAMRGLGLGSAALLACGVPGASWPGDGRGDAPLDIWRG
jgi:hypothetical protein